MTSMEVYQRPFTFEQASGREIKRRRRRRRRECEIPNDIVEEILVRLPAISLIRLQFVSKHWESLIRSRDFGERYISHQKTKDPKLFFICDDLVRRSKNTLFIKTMTTLEETMTASLEHGRALKFEEFTGYLEISESCDGLVCIYGMTIPVELMNPASGMSISLPLAKIQRLYIDHPNPDLELLPDQDPYPDQNPGPFQAFTRFGFGKDSVTGRYKLVWLYNKYPATSSLSKKMTRCEVLDLQDKKWRFVTTRPLDHHHILTSQRPAFANGSFYWLTGDEEGYPSTQTKLIVFDIHTEMFQLVPTPPFITLDNASPETIGLCNLDGRLCISELKGDCKQEFWWRVKEDNNTTWEKIFSVDLRSTSTWFRGITSQPLTPLAISRDTNKVILSLRDQHNLVAFDLDPDSAVYHLYFSGYYGLAVPYFPSLLLFHSLEKEETPLYVD